VDPRSGARAVGRLERSPPADGVAAAHLVPAPTGPPTDPGPGQLARRTVPGAARRAASYTWPLAAARLRRLYFELTARDGTETFSDTFAGQQAAERLARTRGLP